MGREANTRKERVCESCKAKMIVTARELKLHAGMCKRATDIGLILPGVVLRGDEDAA